MKTSLITVLFSIVFFMGNYVFSQVNDDYCTCSGNVVLTGNENIQTPENYQPQIGISNLQKPDGFGASMGTRSNLDSKGTEFWLLFMLNHTGGSNLYLDITSEVNTSGTVSVTGIGFTQNFVVAANTVTRITLPPSAVVTSYATIQQLGIHVVADNEVTVYGMNRKQATTDGFLGLPLDVLDNDYMVMCYPGSYTFHLPIFAIVSPSNGNVITITPSDLTFNGNPAGVPFNITLNQGETYMVRGQASTSYSADQTGSIISSTLPVAVFSGNECANIPQFYAACDHIVEQMPPLSTWGESFITRPLDGRLYGDTWRFLSSENGTSLSINGVVVATLNFGDFYETILTSSSYVTSSNPILAAQFSNGQGWDGVVSDPFMMIIPPYQQFLGSYIFSTPASGFVTNKFTSAVQTSGVGGMLLNGNPLNPASYLPVGSTGYSVAAFPLVINTSYILSNSGAVPSGLYLYGFDSYDSYGYTGGQAFGAIATITSLTITPVTGSANVGTMQCWVAQLLDQFGAPVPGVRVDFTITGPHSGNSGYAFTDIMGNATYCFTGTNTGQDIIVANVGSLNATAQFEWISAEMIPLANWAIYLGVFLAITIVVVRFRKMI
jgi:hypothetical protein